MTGSDSGPRPGPAVGPAVGVNVGSEMPAMDPGWAEVLRPAAGHIAAMRAFLDAEVAAGRGYLPEPEHVFAAFGRPFADVKVLIVGQDPYPTPGQAMGLSFSVPPDLNPLPRSLANIFRELADDLGGPPPPNGDLRRWADQGVLLLNRVLTVRPGQAGSHRGRGWEPVTDQAVRALAARGGPLVAVLWGRQAQSVAPLLPGVPVVTSAHPSPLSASRGFFGSRPFSRVNNLLCEQGTDPINWVG